jgi:hypothetical protein
VETTNARKESKTLAEIGNMGIEQIGRMIEAWKKSGFL